MKPIFKNRRPFNENIPAEPPVVGAQRQNGDFFRFADAHGRFENELYRKLRRELPVIDAAIGKIIRLTGSFKIKCADESFQQALDEFCDTVPVNLSGVSLGSFIEEYLDGLLTNGKAVGEILVDEKSCRIIGLCNASSADFHVKEGKNPVDRVYYTASGSNERIVARPERILFTALNPTPEYPEGVSILRGVPALSEILGKIYQCIGRNFERVGNVRYAVTCKPTEQDGFGYSKERAMTIAREWSDGMQSAKNGIVKDFVAVGDIDIKVIGAENQLIDTNVPVRQLLEQILSKLSIPPFLLGLNWTSTERMSAQQVDILTSELEYYRRLINPVLRNIAAVFLRLNGCDAGVEIVWDNINLQDESELAKARLYNAQAEALELENAIKKLELKKQEE